MFSGCIKTGWWHEMDYEATLEQLKEISKPY